MLPLAIASIAAGASVAGGISTNRTNAAIAQRQMDFQREMSNTAAQRAQADFAAAGLNPALAYGTQASSPGGASATMGNPFEAGVNSARSAYLASAELQMARQQNDADLRLKNAQTAKSSAEALYTEENRRLLEPKFFSANTAKESAALRLDNLRATQPHDIAAQAIRNAVLKATGARIGVQTQLGKYLLPGAKAQAAFDSKAGGIKPTASFILNSAKAAKGIIK